MDTRELLGQRFDHRHAAGVTRFQVDRPHRDPGYFECVAVRAVEGTHHFIGGINVFSRAEIVLALSKECGVSQTLTPGPWALEARGAGIPVFAVYGQHDQHVAKVDGAANARLIAAAPELLAAVKMFLERLPECWGDEVRGGTLPVIVHEDAVYAAEAAIAKAEGR